jgi:hypothetical protein
MQQVLVVIVEGEAAVGESQHPAGVSRLSGEQCGAARLGEQVGAPLKALRKRMLSVASFCRLGVGTA